MNKLSLMIVFIIGICLMGSTGVLAEEEQTMVSTVFYETDIREALNELSLQTGVNIIYDETITGMVTLDLVDVPLERALQLILLKGGYFYQQMDDIYLVGVADPRGSTFRYLAESETINLQHLTAVQVQELLPRYYQPFLNISRDKTDLITVNAPRSIIEDFKRDLEKIDNPEPEVILRVLVSEISTDFLQERGSDLFQFLSEKADEQYQFSWERTLDLAVDSVHGQLLTYLRALEREDKATIKANPWARVLNRQTAELFVGEEQVIILEPVNTAARLERVEVGVAVRFTPRIINDELISLNIETDISNFTEERQERLVVRRSDLATSIYVKDGTTLTIAGMTLDERIDFGSKVPILGDLPVLRWFFRREMESEMERELVIFITPEIVGVE